MRVVSLPQPAATLTVTRGRCPDPLCEDGEYKDDSMSLLGIPGGRVGYAPCATCENGTPMVSRWVTFDYGCPSEVVGTRIAIHAKAKEPSLGWEGEIGGWRVKSRLDDGSYEMYLRGHADVPLIPLPLGVVVGSAIVEASYPIVSHLGTADHDCPFPCIAVTESHDYLYVMRGRNGYQDILDVSGQLPFADWSPGRFAWLLTDAAPCQERCPRCLGVSRYPMYCDICDDKGRCDPVPWVSSGGRLPEWQPT